MKQCTRCNKKKPLGEFYHRSGKRRSELYSYCKRCFTDYLSRKWVQRKKDAVEYKGGKCYDCNGDFHYAVFEFHHRDPNTKDARWIKIRQWKEERRLAELDKCDLLCANCHRMRHVKEGYTLE